MSESLGINLPVNIGGTNSTAALNGSSIMISENGAIKQGEFGISDQVLHGNDAGAPYYAKVDLYQNVTSILPIEHGGTNQFATPTAGQILIGNLSSFTLGTITPGEGITVTNSNGGIEIASSASAGFVRTEYTTVGEHIYDIPAGAVFLNVRLQGAGGGGGGGCGGGSCPGAGAGGAGALRMMKFPVDGATTATFFVGTGGAGGESIGSGGTNGGQGTGSSITLNDRYTYASAGGGGGRGSGTNSGGGGGAGGSQDGGNANANIGGGAGSATEPTAHTGFHINMAGKSGQNGTTNGAFNTGATVAGTLAPDTSLLILGNSGSVGGSGGGSGGTTGWSAGNHYGRFSGSGSGGGAGVHSGGGGGGSSGMAIGGDHGGRNDIMSGGAGSLGSGGGGAGSRASGSVVGDFGGAGGNGYASCFPSVA